MKISDLIEKLETIKNKNGDLDVWTMHEWMEPIEDIIENRSEHFEDASKEYFPPMIVLRGGYYDHKREYHERIETRSLLQQRKIKVLLDL